MLCQLLNAHTKLRVKISNHAEKIHSINLNCNPNLGKQEDKNARKKKDMNKKELK